MVENPAAEDELAKVFLLQSSIATGSNNTRVRSDPKLASNSKSSLVWIILVVDQLLQDKISEPNKLCMQKQLLPAAIA
jgi:hypothetical protein